MAEIFSFLFFFRNQIELWKWFHPTYANFMNRPHTKFPPFQINFTIIFDLPFGGYKFQLIQLHIFFLINFLMLFVLQIYKYIGSFASTDPDGSIFEYEISTVYLISWSLFDVEIEINILIHFKYLRLDNGKF